MVKLVGKSALENRVVDHVRSEDSLAVLCQGKQLLGVVYVFQ